MIYKTSFHYYLGAGAGFVQSFFTSPAELVKTQLQVQGMKGKIASGKVCEKINICSYLFIV